MAIYTLANPEKIEAIRFEGGQENAREAIDWGIENGLFITWRASQG